MNVSVTKKKFSIQANTAELSAIRKLINEICAHHQISQNENNMITLAIDEAISSIILQSNELKKKGTINLSFEVDEVKFKVIIDDLSGNIDFNSVSPSEFANLTTKLKKYQIGFFVIREVMDEILYTYKKGFENQLVLIKFLK